MLAPLDDYCRQLQVRFAFAHARAHKQSRATLLICSDDVRSIHNALPLVTEMINNYFLALSNVSMAVKVSAADLDCNAPSIFFSKIAHFLVGVDATIFLSIYNRRARIFGVSCISESR